MTATRRIVTALARAAVEHNPMAVEGLLKIMLAVVALGLLFALTGCGGGDPWPDDACENQACIEPDIPAPSQPVKPPPEKSLPPGWPVKP